jgi:hypothetical protein
MASIIGTPTSNVTALRELKELAVEARDFGELTADSTERTAQILGETFKLPLKRGERIQDE